MTGLRTLRRIHLLSTVWFIACIGYLLVVILRDVGFRWWLIFSLSGPSALVIFLLVSLYLFALYRGLGAAQKIEIEHPLTTTNYYMVLYVAAPLLGALAGTLGMVGVTKGGTFLLGVTLGTLGTTFGIWVIIDPLAGMLEMLLPTSRQHRSERLAQAEAQRRARQEKREHLLAEAFAREQRARQQWQQKLQAQAERLAALLLEMEGTEKGEQKTGDGGRRTEDHEVHQGVLTRAEQEAVDLGAQAWRLGGLGCMRQLHEMTIQAIRDQTRTGRQKTRRDEAANMLSSAQPRPARPAGPLAAPGDPPCDYLAYWWDGIGDWRKPSSD
jgi:hypothetical protein